MAAKDTATYWKTRITKRTIRGAETANYYARLSHESRQAFLNLNTGNASEAANRAAEAWRKLKADGWEAVLPEKKRGADLTVGDWIKAVEDANCLRSSSSKCYARKLRQLASEIKGLGDDSRYGGKKGAATWAAKVDKVKLSDLTTERVKKWRARRLRGITDPLEETRARSTVDSVLRNAKAIFGRKVREAVTLELDGIPLEDVRPGAMAKAPFQPEIEFDQLIENAGRELKGELHLIFLLAAGCGLRRSEIDRLRRQDVDLRAGTLTVTDTEDGRTKTAKSKRTIRFAPGGAVAKALKAAPLGIYAVCPHRGKPQRKAEAYRCEHEFAELSAWLRGQGITRAIQPLHYLRKACGDRVARDHGIAAAANTLGNSIGMAYAVYSDHDATHAIL
jgi:integrase